jgi:hypothetical protein
MEPRLGPSYETDEEFQKQSLEAATRIINEVRRRHMSVRAKFRLNSYETCLAGWTGGKELRTLKFTPVIDGSPENKKFYSYTPSGSLELGTVNPEAWEKFELGKEYYLDFTLAE